MVTILEIAKLQTEYKALVKTKKLSKKAICDLCVPFRDKAGLTDSQTLRIARNEMSLPETLSVCGIDALYKRTQTKAFIGAIADLNFYRNLLYSDSDATEEYKLTQAINTVLPVLANLIGEE